VEECEEGLVNKDGVCTKPDPEERDCGEKDSKCCPFKTCDSGLTCVWKKCKPCGQQHQRSCKGAVCHANAVS
jgi:hypothetical protein